MSGSELGSLHRLRWARGGLDIRPPPHFPPARLRETSLVGPQLWTFSLWQVWGPSSCSLSGFRSRAAARGKEPGTVFYETTELLDHTDPEALHLECFTLLG